MMEVLEKLKEKDFVFNFISSWFVYGDTKLPAKKVINVNQRVLFYNQKYC